MPKSRQRLKSESPELIIKLQRYFELEILKGGSLIPVEQV